MRPFPPVWAFGRQAYEEDEVQGVRVPAGSTVTISAYVTHRDPAYWEHPEEFDPERFSLERSADRPEFAYFPFGGGPRKCIGSQFALMEGRLALAMIGQRFRLKSVPGRPVVPAPILTLRSRDGVPMTLHPRG